MTLKTNPKGPKHSHSLTLTPPSSQTPCVTLISFHSLPHSHLISLTSLKFQLNPRKCTHARTPLCQPPSSQFFFPSHPHESRRLKLYASALLDWVFFLFSFFFLVSPSPSFLLEIGAGAAVVVRSFWVCGEEEDDDDNNDNKRRTWTWDSYSEKRV